MKEPKIAKILDEFNVVLNKGKNDDIAIGQRYLVYRQTEEIIDPDSGETLEALFVPKGVGVISRVQDKISVLTSNEWERTTSIAEAFSLVPSSRKQKPFDKPQIGDCAKSLNLTLEHECEDTDSNCCTRCGEELSEEEKGG